MKALMYLGRNTRPFSERGCLPAGKFVRLTATLETEVFKYLEGSFHREAVDIHDTGLFDHMMGVVFFIDIDSHPVWLIGELDHSIDDEAVILFSVVGGNDIKTVADTEQSRRDLLFVSTSPARAMYSSQSSFAMPSSSSMFSALKEERMLDGIIPAR